MKKGYGILILLLCILYNIGYTQNLLQNGDFQNYLCDWNTTLGVNDFKDNCHGSQWNTITTQKYDSTPDEIIDMEGASTGLESGNYYARLLSYDIMYLNFGTRYEGIYYTGLTFYPNTKYTLKCKLRSSSTLMNLNELNISLNNSLPSSLNNNYFVGAISATNLTWETISISFIPNGIYSQIFLYNLNGSGGILELDDIEITAEMIGSTECCEPYITYSNTSSLPELTVKSQYINTTSSVNVSDEQTVMFQAGEYILLSPGFEAETDELFIAYISACTSSEPAPFSITGGNITTCVNTHYCYTRGTSPIEHTQYKWTSNTPGAINLISKIDSANTNICTPVPTELRYVTITYKLTATNACGATADSITFRYVGCRDGLTEKEHEDNNLLSTINNHKIYPNPSNDIFYITLNIPSKILIRNTNGNDVLNISTEESLVPLNLSSLAKGIYIVTIENKEGVTHEKIILQ